VPQDRPGPEFPHPHGVRFWGGGLYYGLLCRHDSGRLKRKGAAGLRVPAADDPKEKEEWNMGKQIGNRMTGLLWIPLSMGAMALLWYLVSAAGMDNDGYWILATGKELVSGIPKENPFTFVEGLDIVVQQWAWCLLCYRIHAAFGSAGILALCAGLSLAVLA